MFGGRIFIVGRAHRETFGARAHRTAPETEQQPRCTAQRMLPGALPILFFVAATAFAQDAELKPLKPKLPAPAFIGTPKDAPEGVNIEAPSDKPKSPLMIPKDVKNVAASATITSTATNVTADQLAKITDGDKEAMDASIVLLRKGTQHVQLDLGAAHEIFALVLWHAHDTPKVYRDVVVQLADDAAFSTNVRTLFNNDMDNSSGAGIGTDREYFETFEGKTIDAKGQKARYVRFYSKGSTETPLNEYTEVEVYARAVK
jgi:hypothetical protein